jgi:hypothetical protein
VTDPVKTCLVLRTNRFGRRESRFLEKLRNETGYRIAIAADETHGMVDCGTIAKIALTRDTAKAEGLYCTADFAWRCGDYSLYLARRLMPEIEHFWLIEPDVRPAWSDYGEFFRLFEPHVDVDVIAFGLQLSGEDHLWHPTMRQKTASVYRCFFACCRFSARALDICLAERRRDRNNVWTRVMWPNDESFTMSVAIAAGLLVRDANSFGREVYTQETFGFFNVRRGETFSSEAEAGLIYHPVLWGVDFDRKQALAARGVPLNEVLRLKLLRGIMIKRYHRFIGLNKFIGRPRVIPRVVPPPSGSN